MNIDERYEVSHNGEVLKSNTELCKNKDFIINDLLNQFGWTFKDVESSGPYRRVKLKKSGCSEIDLNIFSGNVRNESRSPYEKKIQLSGQDPRSLVNENTIILGVYVYKSDDNFRDALFVGYPIDMNTNYPSNPSIRGTFVDKVLFNGKNKGFYHDAQKNIVAFRSEFIFYYLDNYKKIHYNDQKFELNILPVDVIDKLTYSNLNGKNLLIYGVPGCGKSHYIKEMYQLTDDNSKRVVFHPDYTYSDLVGQILPRTNDDDKTISYRFVPGPFTELLKDCESNLSKMHYLVIEEINRGNAPAIFGEIFQLLDRDKNGISEYSIFNSDIAKEVYGDHTKMIQIPNNLTILSTMNTADQNVFTLDTAFKRRWEMKSIRNNFKLTDDPQFNAQLESKLCDTQIDWMTFATDINAKIAEQSEANLDNEDKRLGHFFIKENEMVDLAKFAEKIIMYLWNDVFKYEKEKVFNTEYKTLEDILDAFQNSKVRFKVFNSNLGFVTKSSTDKLKGGDDTDGTLDKGESYE